MTSTFIRRVIKDRMKRLQLKKRAVKSVSAVTKSVVDICLSEVLFCHISPLPF